MLFIVGPSGAGKSYLAKSLAEYGRSIGRDLTVLESSSWIRSRTGCWENSPEATKFLTQETLKALAEDPEVITKELKRRMVDSRTDILVGLRTVKEFCSLYNPSKDKVVAMLGKPVTEFEERGVKEILEETRQAAGHVLLLRRETYEVNCVWSVVAPAWENR